ncbi:putative ribonuclease H-like domain-containing protein, partial [Tanacetum coccineum]
IDDQEKSENSTQGVNTVGPSINTEPYMFSLGDNATATHADFFGNETEVDMSNITTTYPVPSTQNTRIHKDHLLDHVIGDEEPKKVWTLVDLPHGKRAIGIKWVYMNKKDERGILIRNKTRLVALDYTQEEGIDYDEVFAPVAKIEAIRLFLAYASFKGFEVYQMDVKSAFLYGKIKEEVYVYQPSGFEDPEFPDRVYKVEKALYGLHQAPSAWYETLSTYLLDNGFQRGLQVTQKDDGIFTVKTRPDIMFDVCACTRFQVTPKSLHIHAVKRIFKYLKGQPKLGLWYLKDSPFDLEAYMDSGYVGYALTVNPTIYTSCVKQFWATAKAKTVNGEVQIQALVDGKKVIVTKTCVRRALHLKDAEGTECLPNATIFEQLTLMGPLKLQRLLNLMEEVKKLEKGRKIKNSYWLKRLRKVGRSAQVVSSKDEGLGAQEDASKQGRKIADLDADAEEVEVEKVVSTAEVTTINATTTTAVDELSLAQTLIKIKVAKPKAFTTAATTTTTAVTRPKARGVVVQEPSEFTKTTSPSQLSQLPQAKDKGKEKMVEPEKPLKKKDQILIDEEIAQKLQAQLNTEL